jgi:hypothetical protein
MTAPEFARLLHAKRVTKGKWTARCPAHPDHKPSLAIAEGKKGVLIKCMSHGCETEAILDALGLSFGDLFYASRKMTPELRVRLNDEGTRESLERQLGLAIWLGALEKPAYWAAAQRRIRGELAAIRCRIEPEEVYQEWKKRTFKRRVMKLGIDRLMEEAWHIVSSKPL